MQPATLSDATTARSLQLPWVRPHRERTWHAVLYLSPIFAHTACDNLIHTKEQAIVGGYAAAAGKCCRICRREIAIGEARGSFQEVDRVKP